MIWVVVLLAYVMILDVFVFHRFEKFLNAKKKYIQSKTHIPM